MNSLSTSRLPPNMSDCIAIVCNGELEYTTHIANRIRSCSKIIGVDGGINHCHQMNIIPDFVVGDFDSVEHDILQKVRPNLNITNLVQSRQLVRSRNKTDLELALEKAKHISELASVVIFGGLGGRIDHTLGNLYSLFKRPGEIFLESENQIIFGLNKHICPVQVDGEIYKILALLPLYGKISDVFVEDEKHENGTFQASVSEDEIFISGLHDLSTITIENGEPLVVLDKKNPSALSLTSAPVNFSSENSIIQIFKTIVSTQFLSLQNQTIVHITPSIIKRNFSSKVGQIISLIPLFGPATGVETEGLYRKLGPYSVSTLDKDTLQISDFALDKHFSIQIKKGHLLCIINTELINESTKSNKQNQFKKTGYKRYQYV